MTTRALSPVTLAMLGMLSAAPAFGGVIDEPLPVLGGQKAKHLFTVTGVLKHAAASTSFVCTSLEKKKTMRFRVETFDENGALLGFTGSLLQPGATRVSGLGNTLYSGIATFPPDSSTARTSRIVGTSSRLMCTAMVLEPTAADGIPGSGWALPMIKKTSQKGD